jgi:hypothetical protein
MKNFLFYFVLFSCIYVNAQTTIVEEKYDKENMPIDHFLLPNSNLMIVSKGKQMGGLVVGVETNSMFSYDSEGNKKVIFTDQKMYNPIFSDSENAILTSDISSGIFNTKTKYLINGKYFELSKSDLKDINYAFGTEPLFTSKYSYNLINQNNKIDINLEKDGVFLLVKDISTNKKQTYKIVKPNLDKLIGPNFIKPKEDLGYSLVVNYDETIDLVTKSISKDYTNAILYKTRLSNEGKITNELVYDIKVPNRVLLYSRNNGGKLTFGGTKNDFIHFKDDLSINNYIEDVNNGDIYIYGLYGDELGKLNDMANPKGYYVFKFNKSGKKIWESINKIEDNDFNKAHTMITIFVDLVQLNNNLCFTIRVNGLGDFFNYSLIDKSSGNIIKTQNIEFNETFAHLNNVNSNTFNINSNFKKIKDFKGKEFNFYSIVALNSNPKIYEYIKNVKSNKSLFFRCQFSDKGIWLYERADKEYYKITLFKD